MQRFFYFVFLFSLALLLGTASARSSVEAWESDPLHWKQDLEIPAKVYLITEYGAAAGDDRPDTQAIQDAIDACAQQGGGTVRIPKGTFVSGGLTLKSRVHLHLEEGAVLQGSANYKEYGEGGWSDGFLKGVGIHSIRISGGGTIDGVNCKNPEGEEGFRGPHAIYLKDSRNIIIEGITIRRAANYAVINRECSNAEIAQIRVHGGHDGVNVWESRNYHIHDCVFKTGDDCIAGTANQFFLIENCQLNSSCNAFRFACDNLILRDCRIWGPGEYMHRVSKRTNMLAAFVHFSPGKGKQSEPVSDNWRVENLTIENANHFYLYDYEKGLWQTVRPVKTVRFQTIEASKIRQPILINGDGQIEFYLRDVTIDFMHEKVGQERTDPAGKNDGYAFNIQNAARVRFHNVSVTNNKPLEMPVARLDHVGLVEFDHFNYIDTTNPKPIRTEDVGQMLMDR